MPIRRSTFNVRFPQFSGLPSPRVALLSHHSFCERWFIEGLLNRKREPFVTHLSLLIPRSSMPRISMRR